MVFLRYTNEELRHLRNSPHVKKPDRLPPIEQWIEYVYADRDSKEKLRIPHSESQQTKDPTDKTTRVATGRLPKSVVGGEKSPMGNFSTGQRPSLLHTRTAGSRSGDDFFSGQGKTSFSSSRSVTRLNSHTNDPTTSDASRDEQSESRARASGDRQHVRKNTAGFDRENWSTIRERRALGEHEHTRSDSNGGDRNLKTLQQRDRDGDKPDSRWPSKDDRRPNAERTTGGWRDREANRRDRGWERNDHHEREPEWFDEPAVSKHDDDLAGLSQAHTQQDFLKWKDMMNASKKPQEEGKLEEEVNVVKPPQKDASQKPVESLKIEGLVDRPFGSLSGVRSPDPANAQSSKAKASRFASMFKKEDSPVTPDQQPPPPASAPPAMLTRDAKEDKEGFQRILQMLGGTNINSATSPAPVEPRSPPRPTGSGARQRSRFFDSNKGPDGFPFSQAQNNPMPEGMPAAQQFPPAMSPGLSAHQHADVPADHQGKPLSADDKRGYRGGASTPDINLQAMLANQRVSRPAASNKDSEFLLGLLQGHSARPASQVSHPNPDFPLWLSPSSDNNASKQGAPPPPAHNDDRAMRNGPLNPGRPQQQHPAGDKPGPQQPPRAPPGFDDQARLGQVPQQRNGPDMLGYPPQQFDPARRPPGPPQLPPYLMNHQVNSPISPQGPPPNDMLFMQPPPPGLPPHLRHPQGFANIPNIFQAPQQQQHFANGPPPNTLPSQQNGALPPGLGRGMPHLSNGQGPPGLAGMNGAGLPGFSRGQQPGIFEQRR